MSHDFMPYISIAMFAMCFYCFSLIRVLAPIWIILFVISTGRIASTLGLITVLAFTVVLMFFVLDMIRNEQKKAAKKRRNDEDSVSIFNDEETESDSELPYMSAEVNDEDTETKANKPKKTKLTVYEGSLDSFGFAPYNDIPGKDKSFFVECDGRKVWGIGLKDAVKNSGAQPGDTVRFWKEAELRTKKANIFDNNGKITGTRNLSADKRRGLWVMQIISA